MWVNHTKSKGLTPTCPLCRQAIDEDKIEKKEYHGLTVSAQRREQKEKEMADMPSELKKVVESHEDVFQIGKPNDIEDINIEVLPPHADADIHSEQTEEVVDDALEEGDRGSRNLNAISPRQMGSRREGEVIGSSPPSHRAPLS
mmetsp:Transcript_30009/g.45885  ORF Transcript_30009/g.45885 Transcript_30009/m.45885 type:complete len:144 (+) Transcript_30009:1096-1527(+)